MIINHMFMGQLVDQKKVDESAHKRANDRYSPRPVLVHYHLHSESCRFRENITTTSKLDDKHKMFDTAKEEENA